MFNDDCAIQEQYLIDLNKVCRVHLQMLFQGNHSVPAGTKKLFNSEGGTKIDAFFLF